jgi:leader peptidase (prepilin peptidase)/N-methyltransferase
MTLGELPPLFLRVYAVLFGLVWGSFLNVVIYRVPREMSVVRPGSHCPGCGKPIKIYDNIPVLGWLVLRGRARCCGVKVSPRYPLVEAIGGVLSLAILEIAVFSLPPDTSIARAGAIYVADLALALGLVATAFIDLEHMYVPDEVTFGGAVLGIATSSFREIAFTDALIGAAFGFAVIWLPFGVLYKLLRGRAGMGMGDAKLLMLAGAWFGWTGAFFTLCVAAVQGTVAMLITLLVRGKIEDPEAVKREREELEKELAAMTPEERAEAEKELADDPLAEEPGEGLGQARLAFGPFLALGTIESLLGAQPIVTHWLEALFDRLFVRLGIGVG